MSDPKSAKPEALRRKLPSRLTPAEIEDLRKDGQEAGRKLRELIEADRRDRK